MKINMIDLDFFFFKYEHLLSNLRNDRGRTLYDRDKKKKKELNYKYKIMKNGYLRILVFLTFWEQLSVV